MAEAERELMREEEAKKEGAGTEEERVEDANTNEQRAGGGDTKEQRAGGGDTKEEGAEDAKTKEEGAGGWDTKEEGAEDAKTKEQRAGGGDTKEEGTVLKTNIEGEREGEGATLKGGDIGEVSAKGGEVEAKEESEGERQQNSHDEDEWQTPDEEETPLSPGEEEEQMETDKAGRSERRSDKAGRSEHRSDKAGRSECRSDKADRSEHRSDKAGRSERRSDSECSSGDELWPRPWRHEPTSHGKQKIRIPKLRSSWSSQDTLMYRRRYPGKRDNPGLTSNYEFYTNKIPSYPDGDLVDNIHQKWWGNYWLLEGHHGYIQWLFPIRESGMNFYSEELQLHEIEKILADDKAHRRVLRSYEMMLDFYGMKLKDPTTGELERADHWKDRFRHLNLSMHNYLRITRILKSLGEFQYEHLKGPFVRFVLHEAIVERTLTRTLDSCMNYWVEVIRDDKERGEIRTFAEKLAQKS